MTKFFEGLLSNISSTIRKLTAALFIIFTIGMFVGAHVANTVNPDYAWLVYLLPVMLAVFSWISTEFAVLGFILFVLIVLLV